MRDPLHPRAFKASVVWTLALLLLGSVVHATESSLACPDWPTCYGTMVPEMEGGIFWEHLHRLVAGGLILLWGLGTWLAWRERAPRGIVRGAVAGIVLLLVQAVFGGLTVLMRLPDAVSTTHLGLALLFLALATVLAVRTAAVDPDRAPVAPAAADTIRRTLRLWGGAAALLVFAQSLLGGAVRHMEAGMACPDLPLCLGRVVPPLVSPHIVVHFGHRVLALLTAVVVLAASASILRATAHAPGTRSRRLAGTAAGLVVLQVGLGVASVATVLAVVPVSLHTLVAAALLATLIALWAEGSTRPETERTAGASAAAAGAAPARASRA